MQHCSPRFLQQLTQCMAAYKIFLDKEHELSVTSDWASRPTCIDLQTAVNNLLAIPDAYQQILTYLLRDGFKSYAENAKLYFQAALPQDLQQYKNSYIILHQAVYYINNNGQSQLISNENHSVAAINTIFVTLDNLPPSIFEKYGCGLIKMLTDPKIIDFKKMNTDQYIITNDKIWYFNHTENTLVELRIPDDDLKSLSKKLNLSANRFATRQELNLIIKYARHFQSDMNREKCNAYMQDLYAYLSMHYLGPQLVNFQRAKKICRGAQRPIESPGEELGSRCWSLSHQAFELLQLLGCMKHINNEQTKPQSKYTKYDFSKFSTWFINTLDREWLPAWPATHPLYTYIGEDLSAIRDLDLGSKYSTACAIEESKRALGEEIKWLQPGKVLILFCYNGTHTEPIFIIRAKNDGKYFALLSNSLHINSNINILFEKYSIRKYHNNQLTVVHNGDCSVYSAEIIFMITETARQNQRSIYDLCCLLRDNKINLTFQTNYMQTMKDNYPVAATIHSYPLLSRLICKLDEVLRELNPLPKEDWVAFFTQLRITPVPNQIVNLALLSNQPKNKPSDLQSIKANLKEILVDYQIHLQDTLPKYMRRSNPDASQIGLFESFSTKNKATIKKLMLVRELQECLESPTSDALTNFKTKLSNPAVKGQLEARRVNLMIAICTLGLSVLIPMLFKPTRGVTVNRLLQHNIDAALTSNLSSNFGRKSLL